MLQDYETYVQRLAKTSLYYYIYTKAKGLVNGNVKPRRSSTYIPIYKLVEPTPNCISMI